MFATVRNRRGVVSAVEPFDGIYQIAKQAAKCRNSISESRKLVAVPVWTPMPPSRRGRTAPRQELIGGPLRTNVHEPEAQAHFRRLAGYLRKDDVRSRVRKDRSWFDVDGAAAEEPVLRIVTPDPARRYIDCVPLVPLKAAADAFGDPQFLNDGEWDWVEIDAVRRLREGMFVAKVEGKSMEPRIPDGSYCLFSAPVTGSRQGKIVLVELRDAIDPDTGERYTVKRYASEKSGAGDGAWRHVRVTLEPLNPDYEPIELKIEDEERVKVVAELVEVVRREVREDAR